MKWGKITEKMIEKAVRMELDECEMERIRSSDFDGVWMHNCYQLQRIEGAVERYQKQEITKRYLYLWMVVYGLCLKETYTSSYCDRNGFIVENMVKKMKQVYDCPIEEILEYVRYCDRALRGEEPLREEFWGDREIFTSRPSVCSDELGHLYNEYGEYIGNVEYLSVNHYRKTYQKGVADYDKIDEESEVELCSVERVTFEVLEKGFLERGYSHID